MNKREKRFRKPMLEDLIQFPICKSTLFDIGRKYKK